MNPDYWSLSISRAGFPPLLFTRHELAAFPTVETDSALVCARRGVASARDVRWHGVPLAALTDTLPPGRFARLWAVNGYSAVLPTAMLERSILAFARDGRALTAQQGSPVRLIVPGAASFKSVKWLRRIEIVETPAGGFWETRGWPLEANLSPQVAFTMPRQQHPGEVVITGTAYAGTEQIRGIQVSIDGGTWLEARFAPPAVGRLIHWSLRWHAGSGEALALRARLCTEAGEAGTAPAARSLFAAPPSHETVLYIGAHA